MHGNELIDLIGCISFNLPYNKENVPSLPVYLEVITNGIFIQSDHFESFFSIIIGMFIWGVKGLYYSISPYSISLLLELYMQRWSTQIGMGYMQRSSTHV